MIVYRSARRTVSPARWLRETRITARRLARGSPAHHEVRELLMEVGALEAAVADALNPEADALHDAQTLLRAASCEAARALCRSWDRCGADALRTSLTRATCVLDAIGERSLPPVALAGTPEGYAFYALYPEGYLDAARRLARAMRPTRAVCIGIRGIGTSLAAAAVAGLETVGCVTRSFTVRPRAHPFARRVILAPTLAEELRRERDALFVVADEGPGLSGSSFGSVSLALAEQGVPDDAIALLPSWLPDPDRLISPEGRERWMCHRKFVTSFEESWLDSGRLLEAFGMPDAELIDLSAGAWRSFCFEGSRDQPPVHPGHERRKYLLIPRSGATRSCGAPSPTALAWAGRRRGARIVKFAGFGPRGRALAERARRLAEFGFAPCPLGYAEGFMAFEISPGTPLSPRSASAHLIDRMAAYLALLHREFRVSDECDLDALCDLVEVNVPEGLGGDWHRELARFGRMAQQLRAAPAIALDARMLPHEWIADGSVLMKVDGVEHHDDHFYPGPHDIAWDLAAAAEEFVLTPSQITRLTDRYRALTRDPHVDQRLPFHRVAYLAFRLGYATLALQSLAGTTDGERWRPRALRLQRRLRRALTSL